MSATIYVEIHEFRDEEVLQGALRIIEDMKAEEREGDPDVQRLRKILMAFADDEPDLPPPSTAASILDTAALKAWQLKERGGK